MNNRRIVDAAWEIDRCLTALKWLEQTGVSLTSPDDENFAFTFHPSLGGACAGANEASEMLGRYAGLRIQEIVADSIANCRNTIEACKKTILDEASQ